MTENKYAQFARIFVHNRQLSLLLILASFIAGIFSFLQTPKQYNPEITLPAYLIQVAAPSMESADIETHITRPIESALREISLIEDITSTSTSGEGSTVTALFSIGTSLETATMLLHQKVLEVEVMLPAAAQKPNISRIDPDSVPVYVIALTNSEKSIAKIRESALMLKKEIEKIPNITEIRISGGQPDAFRITPHLARMKERGVTLADIERQIATHATRTPLGTTEGGQAITHLTFDATLNTPTALDAVRVGGTPTSPVYLGDVANVTLLPQDSHSSTTLAGGTTPPTDAVFISIAKKEKSNVSEVTQAIQAELDAATTQLLPPDTTITVLRDEGRIAREEIYLLTEHLFISIGIVTLALLYFLGLRAALVVATTIPLTLALVFIVGHIADQNINRITLFALIFSLGLLVDDAIVVVENIFRRLKKYNTSMQEVAIAATGEVGMGVLLATITAVIVFLPMGFVGGMMGAYMGPIAFFAPVARLASLFVAYSFSPYLASRYLSREALHEEAPSRLEKTYHHLMRFMLSNKKVQRTVIATISLITLLSFLLPVFELVHFRMLPKADREQVTIYIDGSENTSAEYIRTIMAEATTSLLTMPEVLHISTSLGTPPVADFAGLFRGSQIRTLESQMSMTLHLTHPTSRDATSEEVATTARALLTPLLTTHPLLRLRVLEDPPGPPVQSTLLLRVSGPDQALREDIARKIAARMRDITGVRDIDASLSPEGTRLLLVPDNMKITSLGISPEMIAHNLQLATQGASITTIYSQKIEGNPIFIRLSQADRTTLDNILATPIRVSDGSSIAARDVVSVQEDKHYSTLTRFNGAATTFVGAEMENRSVVYAAKDIILYLLNTKDFPAELAHISWDLFGITLQSPTGETYTISFDGEFEMTLENFRDLGLAMLISFFMMYAVLVAQFKHFVHPVLIMVTIPLAFAGILPGFAILDRFGIYFSATSMIGVIALGGIVVGNAILLLDFIEQKRAAGANLRDAITEGCTSRIRPIFLTALTAILGSVVIVADPVWSGLAWALILGLSFSTILTLIVFPILYLWVEQRPSGNTQEAQPR